MKLRTCKYFLTLFISLNVLSINFSQELEANVRVNAPNLSVSDKIVVGQMESAIKEFLNNQTFTGDVFQPQEKIKCNFQVNIREDLGGNNFKIDIGIQATRPVYNSNYDTPILNLQEKNIPIHFEAFKSLQNSKEIYVDNMSSVFTFYAYLIIAMDYESFSPNGGEPYVLILQNMIASMPATGKAYDPDWGAGKKSNLRYFLIENYINPKTKDFRQAIYEYHRLGLDNMENEMLSARKNILNSIESILAVDNNFPNSFIVQLFVTAKSNEIIEIFKAATSAEKNKIYAAMTKLDPSNSSLYSPLKS